ncbi:MAG: GtrA family protein [Myxococcaceae bacterium]
MKSAPSQTVSGLPTLLKRFLQSWATRSLAVGAVATGIDILVLLACVDIFGLPNPLGAMVGVLVGSTFTFFANRHFAFRDHNPRLAPQAARFAVFTGLGMLAHAWVVYVFANRMGVPLVLAKLGADVIVFTVGQMLVLRYFVFPKKQEPQKKSFDGLAPTASEMSSDRAA